MGWVDSIQSILDAPVLKSSNQSLSNLAKKRITLKSSNLDLINVEKEFIESPIFSELIISEDGKTTGVIINLKDNIQMNKVSNKRTELREVNVLSPDQKVELEQNYPNPFNPKTEISFSLENQDRVTLKIFNLAGQEVLTLMDNEVLPGRHSVSWHGKNSLGQDVSSGMYFYKLTAGDIALRKKLLLLR